MGYGPAGVVLHGMSREFSAALGRRQHLLKKLLTKIMRSSNVGSSKNPSRESKPSLMKKSLYAASKTVTPEKMKEKRGEVTSAEIRTTFYLRKLENAPEREPLEYLGYRYKG